MKAAVEAVLIHEVLWPHFLVLHVISPAPSLTEIAPMPFM